MPEPFVPATPKDGYFRRRYEPAGFPLIGGNSDIGTELGVVGTLSYFADGVQPYRWNQDLLLALSLRGSAGGGMEIVQQSFQWNIDYPRAFGTDIRLNPQLSFLRTVNEGYFGLGNNSSGGPAPSGSPNPDRYHEFIESVFAARITARQDIAPPLSLYGLFAYRFVKPEAYVGSELARDEHMRKVDGSPLLYGTSPLSLFAVGGGLLVDTRDSEIFTTTGQFHQIGVRLEQGFPLDRSVAYAEAGGILSDFVPLGGRFVLAARLLADFQFFHVPFYDLLAAGPFQLKEAPGGSSGVRGVPIGRFLGPIKAVTNVELRAMLLDFHLFQQDFHIGGNLLFDAGRVWSDYTFHSPQDGSGLGLKWGAGGGIYFLWGQAAMFRIEAAYSPDGNASRGFPIGLYIEDGTMF